MFQEPKALASLYPTTYEQGIVQKINWIIDMSFRCDNSPNNHSDEVDVEWNEDNTPAALYLSIELSCGEQEHQEHHRVRHYSAGESHHHEPGYLLVQMIKEDDCVHHGRED